MTHPIARVLPLLEPAHLDRDFDYLVPPELDELAQPGVRVRVRFSGRLIDGYLLERLEKSDHTGKLVRLERVVSGERVLTPEILKLVAAVASRYAGTRADVLRLAIPPRHAKVESEDLDKPAKPVKTKRAAKKATPDPAAADPAESSSTPGSAEGAAARIDPHTDHPDPTRAPAEAVEAPTENAEAENLPTADALPGAATLRAEAEDLTADDDVPPPDATRDPVDPEAAQRGPVGSVIAAEVDPVESAEEAAAHRDSRNGEPQEARLSNDSASGVAAEGREPGDHSIDRFSASDSDSALDCGLSAGDTRTEPSVVASRAETAAAQTVHTSGGVESTKAERTGAARSASSQSIVEDFPGWGRYVHGHSFLGALESGRGPRAGWQALPGEDWAKRLAELAAVTVRGGRGAVIMVPDQRDLDRVLAECVALVGESAVGLAAGLGPSARYRRWLSVLRGTARVVVGTRSAVFSPVQELGLIAIWDDGDDTFAEPRSPYPHAREVAMLRAHETGAAFVAGGFSRTAEVQAIVESGWAHDLLADRNVVRHAMPRITAPGDTDAALERDPIAQAIRIPAVAFGEARKALKAGGAVLVQVPRRGYIPALSCAKCRTPARCRHCNGPLALPDGSSASRGVLRSGREGVAEAQSPSCRWCGITEAAFRCGACGSRALRAVVIGAARTAEELGRAFPGVPVRGSGGSSILDTVPEGAQVVVSTIGAEPRVPGGYAVAMLLDGWALLGRADLRAAEDALRRWMSAAALVRPDGRVIVMADAGLPTVQALVRWDPVWHAGFELDQRAEVRFPPAVRFAAIDGTTDSIAELLSEAKLPDSVEILGPVPLPPGARKPFSSGDSPAEVERMILRADRAAGAALSRALAAAQAIRSTHRSDAPLRVQIDPVDIG
uniref:primosomal protein N' n=1 Tax=Nocardia terrae TaxID=2675851 RepID=UPI001F492661|nr:primosomal protein N' [Nocardia terrae]